MAQFTVCGDFNFRVDFAGQIFARVDYAYVVYPMTDKAAGERRFLTTISIILPHILRWVGIVPQMGHLALVVNSYIRLRLISNWRH